MVFDTSVVIQIMMREAGWLASLSLLKEQQTRLISAASLVEVQAVLSRDQTVTAAVALSRVDEFVLEAELTVMPLTLKQSHLARAAYLTYGKGHHPAGLNYGDVMSYALAKATGETLVFVGDDFQHTDLKVLRVPPG